MYLGCRNPSDCGEAPEMFHVYRLPPRRVANGALKHGWSYGARLGRNATGQWSNMVEGSTQPPLPPALRKVNWRELLQILQASQQVGLPCSVNTDASLGWPLYGYQSFEISMENCLGARHILLRILGQRCKGSEAGRKEGVAQRAKRGFCPCCSRATHVLIPATYEQGQFGRRKANAVRLWQLYGPMASRAYAAAIYFNSFKYIPAGWNWIAAKHEVSLPPALDSEALRPSDTPEKPESHLALEDVRRDRSLPIPLSPVSSGWSSISKAPRKPPPPIRPESPVVHPKSPRHTRPSRSSRKNSRDGDWKASRDGQWNWKKRS